MYVKIVKQQNKTIIEKQKIATKTETTYNYSKTIIPFILVASKGNMLRCLWHSLGIF